MKTLIVALLLSTPAFAGSSITLGPGSTAEIKAGDTTTVSCSGSLPGNSACYCTQDSYNTALNVRLESGEKKFVRYWSGTGISELTACKTAMKGEYAAICSQ